MKSKSFDLKRASSDKAKANKSYDFVSLYKTAADTNNSVSEKQKVGNGTGKENSFAAKSEYETPSRETSGKKQRKRNKQEPLDISCINIEGPSIATNLHNTSPLNQSKVTSTPHDVKKEVKSIMKNSSENNDDTMDNSWLRNSKPKKRNKSVSFMIEDNEEIVKKKTKSDESLVANKANKNKHNIVKGSCEKVVSKIKKMKKRKEPVIEKAKSVGDMDIDHVSKDLNKDPDTLDATESSDNKNVKNNQGKKKKIKKMKKQKSEEKSEDKPSDAQTENNNEDQVEIKNKKLKKKKHKKVLQSTETAESGEPVAKSRKKEDKPEAIAENLENLTIGDNPHTLTNLLDEMMVTDKDKKKKIKRKQKKEKVSAKHAPTVENAEDNNGEIKEKVKWKKRKWNKDKKGEIDGDNVPTTVIIENLPLSMMCSYKKVLADHFEKCGLIRRIGVAEMNLEDQSMMFATTINFYSDDAATLALEEDGSMVEGSKIHVKRTLPPTKTTIVLRSYAPLSDQSVCTTFAAAGKIRNIRHLIKGKKAMETVFVEFDGPEAVSQAIELAKGAKVGGKRLHVDKFQLRTKKPAKAQAGSENEGDSELSDD